MGMNPEAVKELIDRVFVSKTWAIMPLTEGFSKTRSKSNLLDRSTIPFFQYSGESQKDSVHQIVPFSRRLKSTHIPPTSSHRYSMAMRTEVSEWGRDIHDSASDKEYGCGKPTN
jgi:hypothetical protein